VTTELVLLLGLFAFLVGGALFGKTGPVAVFGKSGPRLAARLERNVQVGREFKNVDGSYEQWIKPSKSPDGEFK
jgi:hypothetical protein